jgi:hypothetical protein
MKNVYVVLGMPRSGTSAIARGLKALGVNLGEHLIPADSAWNAKGFWEDTDIVHNINRTALTILENQWADSSAAYQRLKNDPELAELRRIATQLLQRRMEPFLHWGFKDPRTSMLLPLWKEIFGSLDLTERYVIALRNPLSSAYSYQKVRGTDIEEGLLLWLMHLIPAIDETEGKMRVVVSYDAILQEPYNQLLRIHDQISMPVSLDAKEISEYCNEFLDKRLHHHEYSNEDLKSHPASAVFPLCQRTYTLLQKLTRDEITFDSEEFMRGWQSIKEEFIFMQPLYRYVEVLLNQRKALARENRKRTKSFPWRLIYPLRFIDDKLRNMRKKASKKRKVTKIDE